VILVHAQDIVKAMPADAQWPDLTAIPCEFIGNYEWPRRLAAVPG